MSLRRGTSLSVLQISCLSLFSIVKAFSLLSPPTTFPGDSLEISWDASPNDPKDFDLEVGFCENFDTSFLFDQPAIDTQSSDSRRASIPKTLPSGLELPVACSVKAFNSDTRVLLDSISFKLVASDSSVPLPVTTTTRPPTTVTSHSRSSPDRKPGISKVPTPSSSPTKPSSSSSSSITDLSSSIPTDISSSSRSSSSSTVLTPNTTKLPTSSTPALDSGSTIPTTSEIATSGPTTTTTSPNTQTHSSTSSDNAERPIGPLLGEVLGGAFAFLVLLFISITWCVWRRRRRRQEERRIANPFVSDEGYSQPISKREEIENERVADVGSARTLQLSQEPVVLVATEKVDLERGDSVGSHRSETGMGPVTATVEEEVTLLRERVMALEYQHRELTGEFRSAVIPPVYSQ